MWKGNEGTDLIVPQEINEIGDSWAHLQFSEDTASVEGVCCSHNFICLALTSTPFEHKKIRKLPNANDLCVQAKRTSSEERRSRFQRIDNKWFHGGKVLNIAAGGQHSLFVTDQG